MPLIAGRMISRITRACSFGVTIGAGEYAPMPPVFGPWSPSRKRLWSWLVASGRAVLPSARTMKLASSPARNSSMTTRLPAAPRSLAFISESIAAFASAMLAATTTPLPAARPSALITIGAPRLATKALASSGCSKLRCSAVAMPWRSMNDLAKSFEASSCAAALVGGGDHLVVARAAAGLDPRGRARIDHDIEAVAKGKEGIGGHRRALQLETGRLRLHGGDARAVDPAHLAGADAEGHALAREHDGVGLDELRHAPGELEVRPLGIARRLLRHDLEIGVVRSV